MSDNISVRIILDPENERSNNATMLQILKKSGIDVSFHCKDGFCGHCKMNKPLTDNLKIKEGKTDLASYNKETENLACISVIEGEKTKLNIEGLFEIDFIIPIEKVGNELKNKIESGELTDDKMWVYNFAKKEAKVENNNIFKNTLKSTKFKLK